MRDGRPLLLLLFLLGPTVASEPAQTPGAPATAKEKIIINKDGNKYYSEWPIPHQEWEKIDSEGEPSKNAYRHELVVSGALTMTIHRGSNYSVHPTAACGRQLSFILQLQPPPDQLTGDANNRATELQQKTCTISITIDDGHVEVWYGLCLTAEDPSKRRFHFPLNPMAVTYFTFDKLTVRMFRKDSDHAEAVEMGAVAHESLQKDMTAFSEFHIFLHHAGCGQANLKEVYGEHEWRRIAKKDDEEDKPSTSSEWRMAAIVSVPFALCTFICALMSVWSIGVPFPTNPIFDAVFSGYNTKTGAITRPILEEQKSCRSAEEPSEEWEGTGKKENLFAALDKGKTKAPMRAPPGYALPDYNAPYEDDPVPPEACMQTAIDVNEDVTQIPDRIGDEKTPPSQEPPGKSSEKVPETAPATVAV